MSERTVRNQLNLVREKIFNIAESNYDRYVRSGGMGGYDSKKDRDKAKKKNKTLLKLRRQEAALEKKLKLLQQKSRGGRIGGGGLKSPDETARPRMSLLKSRDV